MQSRRFVAQFFLLCVIIVSLLGCDEVGGREIVVYVGCNNIEVISDIDYSIKDISKYLSKNNIGLIVDNESLKCGYTLINASNLKNIESALTDVDLREEINRFYGITSH